MTTFAGEHPEIESRLIEVMLGFDSVALSWRRSSSGRFRRLSSSPIDNPNVTQNKDFDVLLDGVCAVVQARADRVIYLRDGLLVDAGELGPWQAAQATDREDELLA